ncbi:hypothetical protein PC9H_010355 [Pleurotus ostreatus]|uniref:Phytocyanin domain-containing protein n=3 Tax=Pleurotus TaxID=5320 RepID=A0A067NEE9_PLEO1|nr:uncharacterized protein PC9H_010355 [Pleurotus ostreatus]KAF7422200.1 hypothetical protein PC9H_010355 [Pleurotus ostreatus]KAG9227907.1 hypothetical protein CCMSSC00406_0009741 [Pleurotus cornucopiae]KDQ26229.1 hypothetical protein PLEOSDRAFT_1097654 [Pleurotus ostreatus PC15]
MRFTSIVAAALAVVPSALAANFAVNVGQGNTFAFNPTSITGAVAGDTITFTFMSRNHSATTTTFTTPCPPPAGGVPGGFDTGFLSATGTTQPQAVVTLASGNTQWVACRQAGGAHCRMGMTFAVNPTAEQTYEQFLANARG